MTAETQLEFERLLSALCDGEMTDAEHARLEELLNSDRECRRCYLQFMDLHGELLNGMRTRSLPDTESAMTCSAAMATTPAGNAITPGDLSAAPDARTGLAGRLYRYFLVVAGTVALTAVVQVYWHKFTERTARPDPLVLNIAPAPFKNVPPDHVATLRETVDWDGNHPLQSGARLSAGEFRVRKGIAYVQFDSGPELVVEGPAVLRLESSTQVTVLSGKVVLRADETAAPFDLHTPNSVFAENGTEFAVSISDESEEIHVFEGEVQRQPKFPAKGAAPQQLKAGEARFYDPKANFFGKPTPCDPKRFVRHVANPARGPNEGGAGMFAYEGFDYKNAGMLTQGKANGGTGWIGPWKTGFMTPAYPGEPMRYPLNLHDGLTRPGAAKPAIGGSFDYAGFATCWRRLAKPVRLDVDAVYYVSFLVQRHGSPSDPFNTIGVMFWTHDDIMQPKFENSRQRLFVGVKKMNHLSARLLRMDSQTPVSLNNGSAHLVVAKLTSTRQGPNRLYSRIYGPDDAVGSVEPTTWSLNTGPFQGDLVFDWLQLHINSKTRHSIDEVRVGANWTAVTAAHQSKR